MPLPKPGPTESPTEFMDRCMGDSVMNHEYPDQSQRAAICHNQWRSRPKKSIQLDDIIIRWTP